MAAPTSTPLLAGQEMDVTCPSCGGGNRIHFPPGANTLMVKCGSCGTDFQAEGAPPPTSAPPPVAPATMPVAIPVVMPVVVPVAMPVTALMKPQPIPVAMPGSPQPIPVAMPVPQQSPMVAKYAQPMLVPQPAMQQQGQMNAQMVPAQTMVLPAQAVQCTCPNCHQVVQSAVTYEMGTGSWLIVFGLCFFGCFVAGFGAILGLLPCCVNDCQDAHHHCPRCNAQIGTKKFLIQ